MRAALTAESAGVPTVSIVCAGFDGQARATAEGAGFPDAALATTVGHVDTQSADEMIANFLDHTVDQIVQGLTSDTTGAATGEHEPDVRDIVFSGPIEEVHAHFLAQGWTDGNPIIPPTIEQVEQFLATSGVDARQARGVATSSGRSISLWSIAVNGVMAGCSPQHLGVLIALADILADPAYGAEHSGNTTGADALAIVSGPRIGALGFNSGPGALREGHHANTSVGRWIRLYLRNVFDFTAAEHDKATFGNPTRTVLAEDMACLAEIGWEPLSALLGHSGTEDVVSMARMNSGTIIGSVFGSTPEEILPYLGNGIARTAAWDLTHVYGLGHDQFQPLLILSPMLARLFAAAGYSKLATQEALFETARIDAATFEKFIGEWSNLTAGRRTLAELVAAGHLPGVFAASDDPNRLVPVVTRPERILIAVAGDPTRANAYALSNDGPHGWWTSKPISD